MKVTGEVRQEEANSKIGLLQGVCNRMRRVGSEQKVEVTKMRATAKVRATKPKGNNKRRLLEGGRRPVLAHDLAKLPHNLWRLARFWSRTTQVESVSTRESTNNKIVGLLGVSRAAVVIQRLIRLAKDSLSPQNCWQVKLSWTNRRFSRELYTTLRPSRRRVLAVWAPKFSHPNTSQSSYNSKCGTKTSSIILQVIIKSSRCLILWSRIRRMGWCLEMGANCETIPWNRTFSMENCTLRPEKTSQVHLPNLWKNITKITYINVNRVM